MQNIIPIELTDRQTNSYLQEKGNSRGYCMRTLLGPQDVIVFF